MASLTSLLDHIVRTRLSIAGLRTILAKRESTKLTERIVYELPFLMLYIVSFHASIYGLHEAFMSLARGKGPSSFLKESYKLALTYRIVYEKTKSFFHSVNKLIENLGDNIVSRFLRKYLLSYAISGDRFSAVNNALKESIALLESSISDKINLINLMIELIMVMSTIVVFLSILLSAKLIILNIMVSSILMVLSIKFSIPLSAMFVYRPKKLQQIFTLVGFTLTILSVILYLYKLLNIFIILLLLVASTLLALTLVRVYFKAYKAFKSEMDSLEVLARAVGLGVDSIESLKRELKRASGDAKAVYWLYTSLDSNKANTGFTNSELSVLVSSVVLNVLRSGVRAKQAIEAIVELLEALIISIKSLVMKSLLYNAILIFSQTMFSLSIIYARMILTHSLFTYTTGAQEAPSTLMLIKLLPGFSMNLNSLVFTFFIASIMGGIMTAKILRGSFWLFFEYPVYALALLLALSFFSLIS